MLAKFSASGVLQWTRSISTGDFTTTSDIAITSDNGIVVAGYTIRDASQNRYKTYLLKTDASGSLLWDSYFNQEV